jgi:Tol biopolymer transport system component
MRRVVVVAGVLVALSGVLSMSSARGRGVAPGGRGVIVFGSDRDVNWGLYSVAAGGGGLRQLPPYVVSPTAWAPDGQQLAFVDPDRACCDLSVVDAKGRVRRLPTGGHVSDFAWSPDGRRIAYADDRSLQPISVIDVKSGRRRTLTGGVSPQWSPDGKWIVFRVPRADRRGDDLYVQKVDGSPPRLVMEFVSSAVKWAAESTRMAFIAVGTGGTAAFAANEDGSQLRSVSIGVFDLEDFDWAPDGTRLVFFGRDRARSNGTYSLSVFVYTWAGRRLRRLIGDVGLAQPAWSPRGDEIAVAVYYGKGLGLYLVHPDGSRWRTLIAGAASAPVWSPDGLSLAVAADPAPDIWVVDTISGRKRQLTQGARYGYDNLPLRWLPAGLPAVLLPGKPVSPLLPSDTVAETNQLRSTHPIDRLAADGSTVAISYASGPRCMETWDVSSGTLTRFPAYGCEEPSYCCSLGAGGLVGFALTGQTLAWDGFFHFAGLDIFDLYSSTTAAPQPTLIHDICFSDNPDCLNPVGDLVGHGDLLVFDTWTESCPQPSYPSPCAIAPKRNGRLWRLQGGHATQIASSAGALTPLAVDGERILVDHGDGTLSILNPDGTPIQTLKIETADFLSAKLQGDDLVVLTHSSMQDYDANTGALRHEWPLAEGSPRLEDLQDGIAVYVAGDYIYLQRLSDGHSLALPALGHEPHAQLEPAGLYYSYNTDDATYPGRVVFVPHDQLPLH